MPQSIYKKLINIENAVNDLSLWLNLKKAIHWKIKLQIQV